MPTTLVNEEVSVARKPRGAGNGNGGNGHGVRDRVSPQAHQVEDNDSMLVLQEIMRLVDASKEGCLSERGKATLFNGTHREIVQADVHARQRETREFFDEPDRRRRRAPHREDGLLSASRVSRDDRRHPLLPDHRTPPAGQPG